MTFVPNIQNVLNKRNFVFGQNFKISQIANLLITLQENRIFKCNITLVIIET
jgi:hypothetical protein